MMWEDIITAILPHVSSKDVVLLIGFFYGLKEFHQFRKSITRQLDKVSKSIEQTNRSVSELNVNMAVTVTRMTDYERRIANLEEKI